MHKQEILHRVHGALWTILFLPTLGPIALHCIVTVATLELLHSVCSALRGAAVVSTQACQVKLGAGWGQRHTIPPKQSLPLQHINTLLPHYGIFGSSLE